MSSFTSYVKITKYSNARNPLFDKPLRFDDLDIIDTHLFLSGRGSLTSEVECSIFVEDLNLNLFNTSVGIFDYR